jgi:hypothetical protein
MKSMHLSISVVEKEKLFSDIMLKATFSFSKKNKANLIDDRVYSEQLLLIKLSLLRSS